MSDTLYILRATDQNQKVSWHLYRVGNIDPLGIYSKLIDAKTACNKLEKESK
jgi:hypothetical protein